MRNETKALLEEAALKDMRSAYFGLQDEVRRHHDEAADWMQRMEVEYTSIMSRITNCAVSYDDIIAMLMENAERQKEIMATLARYGEITRERKMTKSKDQVLRGRATRGSTETTNSLSDKVVRDC
ncbi:unnamed protein product [Heligmosomoides polygyrus]|uniref:TACC_C domain-containing protein n=1 Tax=Heligmosomoides polygyrus TaxID=6339 RepID=A0A183GA94_HELPZ|nr:unnamed protein product [Heligmosomoides polygyrus]